MKYGDDEEGGDEGCLDSDGEQGGETVVAADEGGGFGGRGFKQG
jgi:hypothetical protein